MAVAAATAAGEDDSGAVPAHLRGIGQHLTGGPSGDLDLGGLPILRSLCGGRNPIHTKQTRQTGASGRLACFGCPLDGDGLAPRHGGP